jgi:hypothetical protein
MKQSKRFSIGIIFLMLLVCTTCTKDEVLLTPDGETSALKKAAIEKGKKIKPILPVFYKITGDMAGEGLADDITLTLGAVAFGDRAGTYTGRVTIGNFSYGREKGIRLNFIMADESFAFVVEHYKKNADFGIFYPGDPWRMQTESAGPPPDADDGLLIKGIKVIQQ